MSTHYDTDINYVLHSSRYRPWGWTIRVAIFNDLGSHVAGFEMIWRKLQERPSNAAILERLNRVLEVYKESRDNPEPEPIEEVVMMRKDIHGFLIKRGYLQPGQVLTDLDDLTPSTVERPLWQKVWAVLLRPIF